MSRYWVPRTLKTVTVRLLLTLIWSACGNPRRRAMKCGKSRASTNRCHTARACAASGYYPAHSRRVDGLISRTAYGTWALRTASVNGVRRGREFLKSGARKQKPPRGGVNPRLCLRLLRRHRVLRGRFLYRGLNSARCKQRLPLWSARFSSADGRNQRCCSTPCGFSRKPKASTDARIFFEQCSANLPPASVVAETMAFVLMQAAWRFEW